MICRKCGSDIPDNSTVCAVCASPIVRREPVSQPVAQRPVTQRPYQPAAQNSEIPRPLEFRAAPIQPVAQRPAAQRPMPAQPTAQRPVSGHPETRRQAAPPPVGFRPAPARPAAPSPKPSRPEEVKSAKQAPKPSRPEEVKSAKQMPEQSYPKEIKPSSRVSKQSRPAKTKSVKKSVKQYLKQLLKTADKYVAKVKAILKSDDEEKKKYIYKIGGAGVLLLVVLIVIFSSVGKFFGKLELYDALSTCEWECETEKTSGYFGYSYNDTEGIRFDYPGLGFKGTATFDESRYDYKIKSSKKVVIDGVKYKVKFNDTDDDGMHDEMIFEAKGKDEENAKFAKTWECTSEYHSEFKLFEDTWGFIVKGWQNLLK